jgi:hypothetical protein
MKVVRQRHPRQWRPALIAGAVVLLSALAACAPAPEPAAPSPPASGGDATRASEEMDEPEPTATAARLEAPTLPPSPTSGEEPAGDPLPTPTLRVGLQATDLSTVDLASGEPTLVEFFAFW